MEEWKPTLQFPDLYEVSSISRVRRIRPTGKRLISLKRTQSGYLQACLWFSGKPHWHVAHRLAWEAFYGRIPSPLQINHKNGIKDDNCLTNLEVVTPSYNSQHKFRVLGHAAPNNPSWGEKNGAARLTTPDVIEIRRRYAAGGITWKELASEYNVTDVTIGNVVRRKTWRHV